MSREFFWITNQYSKVHINMCINQFPLDPNDVINYNNNLSCLVSSELGVSTAALILLAGSGFCL